MNFQKAYIVSKNNEYRNEHDYYPTPPIATKTLFHYFNDVIPDKVWEPAAGRGWIAKVMQDDYGRDVVATDLVSYENSFLDITTGVDYIATNELLAPAVITNPPYKNDLAQKFVEKHMDSLEFSAFLVRLNFFGSMKRYPLFKRRPPFVILFSRRINCTESEFGTIKGQTSGMVAYAWFVWGKNVTPGIDWVDPLLIFGKE